MEKKYTALRIIATGMKILAIIVGIITILAVCGILGAGASLGSEINRLTKSLGEGPSGWGSILGLVGSILASILPIITGGTIAIILFAGGEAIYVQLDIEENTRIAISYTHDIEKNTRLFAERMRQSSRIPASAPATLSSSQTNIESKDTSPSSTVPSFPQNNQGVQDAQDTQDTQYAQDTKSSPGELQIKYCPQCGAKVDPYLKNCPECNYDLSLI
jgi:hypothetical protein